MMFSLGNFVWELKVFSYLRILFIFSFCFVFVFRFTIR